MGIGVTVRLKLAVPRTVPFSVFALRVRVWVPTWALLAARKVSVKG
jgi:hypothetical protein